MTRAALALIPLCLLLAACPGKRTHDQYVAEGLTKMGVAVPAAGTGGEPVPKDGVLVFILPDQLAVDSMRGFVSPIEAKLPVNPAPNIVARLDARAATEGVSDKYKRKPGDPYIVPLANALSTYSPEDSVRASIVSSGQAPDQVVKEVRATLAASGFKELYRLVRAADGKLVAEKLAL